VGLQDLDGELRGIVASLVERLAGEGARAVVLTGSVARGTAKPDSDVDLFAVGQGPAEQHEVVDGRLAGIHWFTSEDVRRRLSEPEQAPLAARAWRDALVLHDPDGVAAELQREARRWRWEDIAARADVWAREQLVGWAEYLPKLRRAVEEDRTLDASALAAETALKLAQIVAVANHVTAESENGFWESVAQSAAGSWRESFEQALGSRANSVRDAAEAAVRLFEFAAAGLEGRLDADEEAVLARALETARFPRPADG
jgi:predicted nucleotidyltransferase